MTKDELIEYLNHSQNDHGLDAMAAHGFLCASIVGKPLNDWLSLFFEGDSSAAPKEVLVALTAWRDELMDALKNEEPIALPFDDSDEVDLSEEGDIAAWCIGFVDAMYADESNDWFADAALEEEVADLTLPMVVLSGIADEDDDLAAIKEDEEMMVALVNSIQENLTELFLLFHTEE